ETFDQLNERGTGVGEALSKHLGIPLAEVRDRAKEISFDDFATAMEKNIGGAAQKAGDTFQGAMSNMRAAQGRLGVAILEGPFKAGPRVIGAVTTAIDGLTDRVSAFTGYLYSGEVTEAFTEAFGDGDLAQGIITGVDRARSAIATAKQGITDLKRAWSGDTAAPEWALKAVDLARSSLESLTNIFGSLRTTIGELLPQIGRIAESMGKAVGTVGISTWMILLELLEALVPVIGTVLVGTLETLANLMEDHQGIVTAVVAAWVLLKTAFVGAAIAAKGLAVLTTVTGWLNGTRAAAAGAATATTAAGTAAKNSGGRFAGLAGALNPMNAALGIGIVALGHIMQKNAEATTAANNYAEAVAASEKAQRDLNTQLIESNGLLNEQTNLSAQQAVGAVTDQLQAETEAANSWLDGWRDETGSIWGGLVNAVRDQVLGRDPEQTLAQIKIADAEDAQAAVDAVNNLKLSQEQLTSQITGSQADFDALTARLVAMGEGGAMAAARFAEVRGEILQAQEVGAQIGPVLNQVAETLGVTVEELTGRISTAFDAVPTDVPIAVDAHGAEAVRNLLSDMGAELSEIDGRMTIVNLQDEAVQQALEVVRGLGYDLETLPTGEVKVRTDQSVQQAEQELNRLTRDRAVKITVNGVESTVTGGGFADGGVLPGYSPGVDNMLVPMSGGEGVIIPEAMRALGAGWLYQLNSRFRPGLSRAGYADGGVVGAAGMSPMASDIATAMAPVVSLLTQILTVLGGKAPGDLAEQIGDSTATALATTTGIGAPGAGLTATEQKLADAAALGKLDLRFPHERAEDALAISKERAEAALAGAVGGAAGGVGADYSKIAAALAAFAQTGNLTTELTSLGLSASDPVVKAIVSARNKKKGGLSGDAIAALVEQVIGGGGYTGTLDSSNSSLISSLQKFRDKLGKAPSGGDVAAMPLLGGDANALIAFAQQSSGGKYKWGASDLAKGLSDCSGAVSDLVELITRGKAGPERLFSTADAGEVLKSLGAVEGAVPGALQIGWDAGHMRATLPNGVAFESGGQTGQGATYGGAARGAEGMPNIMSLPVTGAGSLASTVSGMTADMCACVGDQMGGMSLLGGAPGQQSPEMQALSQALTGAVNAVLPQLMTDAMNAVFGAGSRPVPVEVADARKLIDEGNPMAAAALLGLQVGDYNRTGSQGQAADLTVSDGPAFNARGQMYSDTAALIDRSFTSLWGQMKAQFDQIKDVLTQVRDQLVQIGTQLGQAAANAGTGAAGQAIAGMASGGAVFGGVPGKDSVPALLMPNEHVLTTDDVARMGGQQGVYAFRRALARHGGVRGFATGGGVIVNDTVGAEFFGVSQIPIIGAIVNLLVRVLLAVLGVQIEARDTLNEMTDEFRDFRGDFQAFDASGRLLNDTSALVDRSQSSEELAAQERIRILKIVIQALIKYIIEKVVVPLVKAVANSLLSAAGSAAGTAITGASMGMGGQIAGSMVSSLITGVGSAGVDVVSELASEIAVNLFEVLIDMIGDGLLSYFPGLTGGVFGGGLIENLIAGPINAALEAPLALIGLLTGGIGALFAPLLGLLGGAAAFDEGGLALGKGWMPKATIRPERVLSPRETAAFERMVDREFGPGGGSTTTVHADIHMHGTEATPEAVRDRLVELIR
ncbi:MAG: hypothetical protein WDA30_05055, partial [Mycolicibacterium sp.]